jgi:alpha-1,3-rhamnosyl/mannosyltransferase
MFRSRTGVAVYLRSLLRHWPRGHALRPVGFLADVLKRNPGADDCQWANGDGGGARYDAAKFDLSLLGPLALRPLSSVGLPPGLARRLPHLARRCIQKAYNLALSASFHAGRYDAYFEPNHLSAGCRGRTFTTIHDLSVLEHPQWHPADRVAQWRADLPSTLEKTDWWITVSQFSKSRMVKVLGISPDKIEVIPLAARPLPYPPAQKLSAVRAAMGLPQQYFLHLGTVEPRKNLSTLLDAFGALPQRMRRDCPLVLAGRMGWGDVDFWRQMFDHPIAGEVLTCGFVGDRSAAALAAGARAMLIASHYEGFGLPVLEAMACGTPVICSQAEALVEIASPAALAAGATDVQGWTAAMERVVQEESLVARLREASLLRAADFDWAKTAARHADYMAGKLS